MAAPSSAQALRLPGCPWQRAEAPPCSWPGAWRRLQAAWAQAWAQGWARARARARAWAWAGAWAGAGGGAGRGWCAAWGARAPCGRCPAGSPPGRPSGYPAALWWGCASRWPHRCWRQRMDPAGRQGCHSQLAMLWRHFQSLPGIAGQYPDIADMHCSSQVDDARHSCREPGGVDASLEQPAC